MHCLLYTKPSVFRHQSHTRRASQSTSSSIYRLYESPVLEPLASSCINKLFLQPQYNISSRICESLVNLDFIILWTHILSLTPPCWVTLLLTDNYARLAISFRGMSISHSASPLNGSPSSVVHHQCKLNPSYSLYRTASVSLESESASTTDGALLSPKCSIQASIRASKQYFNSIYAVASLFARRHHL